VVGSRSTRSWPTTSLCKLSHINARFSTSPSTTGIARTANRGRFCRPCRCARWKTSGQCSHATWGITIIGTDLYGKGILPEKERSLDHNGGLEREGRAGREGQCADFSGKSVVIPLIPSLIPLSYISVPMIAIPRVQRLLAIRTAGTLNVWAFSCLNG